MRISWDLMLNDFYCTRYTQGRGININTEVLMYCTKRESDALCSPRSLGARENICIDAIKIMCKQTDDDYYETVERYLYTVPFR
jgi:hypothetical protein